VGLLIAMLQSIGKGKTMSDYNGWTNYETWRVNLEIFDGMDPTDMGWSGLTLYNLKEVLKEYANEALETGCSEGLALDYARAFLSSVDFYSIARSMMDAYPEAWADETEEEEA